MEPTEGKGQWASGGRPPSEPRLRVSSLVGGGSVAVRFADLCGSEHVHFAFGGRYAIYRAIRTIVSRPSRRNEILLPAFHCPSVVQPIIHAGFSPRFYAVTPDLRVDRSDFCRKVTDSVAGAVFIRFFGFPSGADDLITECRADGIATIDDWAHSFLSSNPLRLADRGADATIYSFKKLLPSLVGGGVKYRDGVSCEAPASGISVRASLRRLSEFFDHLRSPIPQAPPLPDIRGADLIDQVRASAEPVQQHPIEDAYPYDPLLAAAGLPMTARAVLSRINLEEILKARRRNYEALAGAISGFKMCAPVFSALDEATCPWGLPVKVPQRKNHDFMLRALGVPFFTFGETLHPALYAQGDDRQMIETARELSGSLMVLSIHQDLDLPRLERYAELIDIYAGSSISFGR